MYTVINIRWLSFLSLVYLLDFTFTFNIEELKWVNYEVDISRTPVKREVSFVHATETITNLLHFIVKISNFSYCRKYSIFIFVNQSVQGCEV